MDGNSGQWRAAVVVECAKGSAQLNPQKYEFGRPRFQGDMSQGLLTGASKQRDFPTKKLTFHICTSKAFSARSLQHSKSPEVEKV